MKMLLEEGKSPVNATDMDGLTALHHAVAEGHGDAAVFLLKAGAEADKRDSEGRLAIDLVPDQKVSSAYPALVGMRGQCNSNRCGSIFCKRLRRRELNFLKTSLNHQRKPFSCRKNVV